MEVVHSGKGTDILSSVPKPPTYFNASAKKHYKNIAKALIGAQVLKAIHLDALEILAQEKAQFEFALKTINSENKKKAGSGYIQKFKTGATNISVAVTLKNAAVKNMFQAIKQFGLDPKSEKELKGATESLQGDLFDGFSNRKHN